MIIKATRYQQYGNFNTVALRCPGCGHYGTFENLTVKDLAIASNTRIGIRMCPHNSCRTVIYFIQENNKLIEIFPPLRIDFDQTNIPEKIITALEEAITCHANQCYAASAVMIRKTLDLICQNHEAKGDNLKKRITLLSGKIMIPKELLEGMNELRLLGNDAAHIESEVFDLVGKEEVEVGIEFAKEILKGVYQYSALLSKLKSLKKSHQK